MSLIRDRNILVYLIDVQDVTRNTASHGLIQDAVQNPLIELAVLCPYLRKSSTEANVLQAAARQQL
jgi:hypothetical protein